MSLNPYRPPSAVVADVSETGPVTQFAAPAAKLDAGRGASWIGEGWALFKAAPWMWIVALLILFAVQLLLSLIPLLGDIAKLLTNSVFMVGVLAFAQGIEQDGEADVGKLFIGFREKLGALIAVSALYAVMFLIVVAIGAIVAIALLGNASLFSAANPEEAMRIFMEGGLLGILIVILAVFALTLPIAAAFWFAPGLVFYADLGVMDAMKESFACCFRNWLPFLVYGLLGFLVLILGAMVLGIGLLVAFPVLMASYYTSFRDLFGRKA